MIEEWKDFLRVIRVTPARLHAQEAAGDNSIH